MRSGWLRPLALATLALVASVAPVVASAGPGDRPAARLTAAEGPQDCRTAETGGPVSATAAYGSGNTIALTYDLRDAPSNFTITLRGVDAVTAVSHLERVGDGDTVRLQWTGTGETASVTYAAASASADDLSSGIFLTPTHEGAGVNLTAAEGLVSRELMYLGGEYTVRRTSYGCETIRMVTACGVVVDGGRGRVMQMLGEAQTQLEVGNRWATTTVFPAEDIGFPAKGFSVGRGDVVVRDDSELDTPQNTYLHEYTHVRQRFADRDRITANASWFVEASAEYMAARLALEQGRISAVAYRSHLGEVYTENDAVLAKNTTWHPLTLYEKGSAVLAELDRRLRSANDSASVETVFRAANRRADADDPLTHAELRQVVRAQGNATIATWFDRAVTTDRPATPALASGPIAADAAADARPWFLPDLSGLLDGLARQVGGLVAPPGNCSRLGRLI